MSKKTNEQDSQKSSSQNRVDRIARVAKFRRQRIVVGATLVVVFAIAYIAVVFSYQAGFTEQFATPTPPAGGVALVFNPSQVSPDARTVSGSMLLFASKELTGVDGRLKNRLEVDVSPTLSQGALVYPAGIRPSPILVTLPTPGIVQRYPFDRYQVLYRAQTVSRPLAAQRAIVPSLASVYFLVPGWSFEPSQRAVDGTASSKEQISGLIVRSASTKLIALLLLALMVVLALIAMIVVQSSAAGRMRLELAVASWITAMLFALIPIRGFLPGEPPIGSWIDILVFFWVESVIMVCVALAAIGLIVRSRAKN